MDYSISPEFLAYFDIKITKNEEGNMEKVHGDNIFHVTRTAKAQLAVKTSKKT